MENLVTQIIELLPNMAIALLVMYWQKSTIDELLKHQRELLDRLLTLIERVQSLSDTVANTAHKNL